MCSECEAIVCTKCGLPVVEYVYEEAGFAPFLRFCSQQCADAHGVREALGGG